MNDFFFFSLIKNINVINLILFTDNNGNWMRITVTYEGTHTYQ